MFSGFLLIESNDKSLNWLNNKLRFGDGFRFMELLVFALLFLTQNLQISQKIDYWLLSSIDFSHTPHGY